jgi:hypothetical protein
MAPLSHLPGMCDLRCTIREVLMLDTEKATWLLTALKADRAVRNRTAATSDQASSI